MTHGTYPFDGFGRRWTPFVVDKLAVPTYWLFGGAVCLFGLFVWLSRAFVCAVCLFGHLFVSSLFCVQLIILIHLSLFSVFEALFFLFACMFDIVILVTVVSLLAYSRALEYWHNGGSGLGRRTGRRQRVASQHARRLVRRYGFHLEGLRPTRRPHKNIM